MRKVSVMENQRSISGTIYRYILKEALFSFMIAFFFFFFVFFVNQILLMAQEILAKRVPLYQVALLIIYAIPTIISLSAPFACLVGTLMTVGRLTSDNEILVMLSSGLSYKTVFYPAIFIGIVISILSFFTNDILLPAGTIQFNKLWRRIAVSTPALELEANTVKRFRDTVIVTGDVNGNAIENLIILDKTGNGERRLIMAGSAELKDSGSDGLSLEFSDAFIQTTKETMWGDYDYARASFLQYSVSNDDIMQAMVAITPREMSARDVYRSYTERKAVLNERVKPRKNKMMIMANALENALRAGPENDLWNTRASNAAGLSQEKKSIESILGDRNLFILLIELHRKFSVPFGAFCFVFLAVSLGLMAKKSGQTVGFIFGVIIAVIYWSLQFIGQTMSLRRGTSPFLSMWYPNFLCLAMGVVLTLKRIFR